MGNSQHRDQDAEMTNVTELAADVRMTVYDTQEYLEYDECCWIQFRKVGHGSLLWEKNLMSSLKDLKKTKNPEWVIQLVGLIDKNKSPRIKFLKEINEVKYTPKPKLWDKNDNEMLLTPGQVDQFKKHLKKSVFLSYASLRQQQNRAPNRNFSVDGQDSRMRSSVVTGHNNEQSETGRERMVSSPLRRKNRFQRGKYGDHFRKSFLNEESIMSERSNLRGSLISFVDDTMVTLLNSNDREISKESAFLLEGFVRLSLIIQNHFKDQQSALHQIKGCFVNFFTRKYQPMIQEQYQANSRNLDFPVKKLFTQKVMEQIIDTVKIFIQLLSDTVYDYYNLGSFGNPLSPDEQSSNPLINSEDNILTIVTTIVFKDQKFYNTLFQTIQLFNREREQKFASVVQGLQGSNPEFFQVKPQYCLNTHTLRSFMSRGSMSVGSKMENLDISDLESMNQESKPDLIPYKKCIDTLQTLAKTKAPITKLKIIMEVAESITESVKNFYAKNSMEMQKWILDADQILSIFCYLVVHADLKSLPSHLFILENFATDHQLISITGYYYSVLMCAVEQLEKGNQRSMMANPSNSQDSSNSQIKSK